MHRLRFPALVLMSAAVASAVALAVVGPAVGDRARDRGHGPPSWWSPPRDVRAMLGRDRLQEPRAVRPRARRLRDAPHALQPGRPEPRNRRRARLDPRPVRADRNHLGRPHDRRAAELHPAARVAHPGRRRAITNVVATLRGTDPASADRVYVVSAHYDSRVTDVLDATSDAPGANDDGSGTSAVIELARVFAARPTEATIVFVAFAGEEQGLYGSTHFAQLARQNGWNIQGVLNMDIIGNSVGGNGVRDPRTIRVFSEGVPTSETPAADRAPPVDRRRERRDLAPARALRQGDRRERRHRHARQARLAPRPLPARRRPDPVPRSRAGRRCGSPSRTRTTTTSTRTSASRTARSSATCCGSSTSTTSSAPRASSARRWPPSPGRRGRRSTLA